MRPWTSRPATSPGSRRTERSRRATSVRERDPFDTLVEHDLAVERAVHGTLRRDHAQALDLLVAEALGKAHDNAEAGWAAALGRRVLRGHLDPADVPALALGIHLHGHRGAGGEARSEQLLWARARVGAAGLGRLVDRQVVPAHRDRMPEGGFARGVGLHVLLPHAER